MQTEKLPAAPCIDQNLANLLAQSSLPADDREIILAGLESERLRKPSSSYLDYPELRTFLEQIAMADSERTFLTDTAMERFLELQHFADQRHITKPTTAQKTLQRIFREYSREVPRDFEARQEFDSSESVSILRERHYGETRYLLKLAYEQAPLIPLSESERLFSKAQTLRVLNQHITNCLREINKTKLTWQDFCNHLDRLDYPVQTAIGRPEFYQSFSSYEIALFDGYCSRSVLGYKNENGIDFMNLVDQQIQLKQRPVRCLDLGSYRGQASYGVKLAFEEEVETHCLSLHTVPNYYCDNFYCLPADYLPEDFSGKFDVIVSSRCLEYVALAHKALLAIAESLAPDGVAELNWNVGRAIDWENVKTLDLLEKILPPCPSQELLNYLRQNLDQASNKSETREDVVRLVEQQTADGFVFNQNQKLAIAWGEAVLALINDDRFEVTVKQETLTTVGDLPKSVRIRRVA